MFNPRCLLIISQGGAAYVNDMGGYCPMVDRPEQLLDTVQEATQNVGLTPGQDMYFALNCAAHEWFDMVSCIIILCLTSRMTVTSARIPEEDA